MCNFPRRKSFVLKVYVFSRPKKFSAVSGSEVVILSILLYGCLKHCVERGFRFGRFLASFILYGSSNRYLSFNLPQVTNWKENEGEKIKKRKGQDY